MVMKKEISDIMKKADELSKKRATRKPANNDERRIIIYQQQEHEVNSTTNYETRRHVLSSTEIMRMKK